MHSSAFCRPEQVLPQRGHGLRSQLPHRRTAGSWGSMIGTHGPHRGTLRSCRFAGEMVCGGGANAFGCADELGWLYQQTREVLPQRGHGLRRLVGGRASREMRRRRGQSCPSLSPLLPLQKCTICRQIPLGTAIRALWGQQWARLPFRTAGSSTATTGRDLGPSFSAGAPASESTIAALGSLGASGAFGLPRDPCISRQFVRS